RLPNPWDWALVRGTVSGSLEGLLAALPTLRTGEALIIGESVQLPMRVLITPPAGGLPNSCDPKVVDVDGPGGWTQRRSPSDYAAVVAAWRGQSTTVGEGIVVERQPVESKSACSCGYDDQNEILEIEFMKSGTYQYYDVPRVVYEDLMAAESFGTYLNANIKGVYRYARI
ncbi:MAG: KTSC domain-containing protein, partial [Coriobacteriia bacterium]|nr:KTSC domain-containing protein [Coriobacteriia bacterium]